MIATCEECGQSCETVRVDEGIGNTEAFGIKHTHHDWFIVSKCCGADCYDRDGEYITMSMVNNDDYMEDDR